MLQHDILSRFRKNKTRTFLLEVCPINLIIGSAHDPKCQKNEKVDDKLSYSKNLFITKLYLAGSF